MNAGPPIVILGAGLAGSLLALLLARRGLAVRVLEARSDPRRTPEPGGRSINLALAARGIDALRAAEAMAAVAPLLVPMRGRQLHGHDGRGEFLAYGQRPEEQIYSVSRSGLNRCLLDLAEAHGVRVDFGQRVTALDPDSGRLVLATDTPGGTRELRAEVLLACDGAGSVSRAAMAQSDLCQVEESWLVHGYKELTVPPGPGGTFRLAADALHIWPRGGYMLIALPNPDGSFTCTLFLPHEGNPGFDRLRDATAVHQFFAREFPDAAPLMPNLAEEFLSRPQGHMGTVRTQPWGHRGRILLIGDAAHAIVPFHGQGMNCAFEDCRDLAGLIDRHGTDWATIFPAFERLRRPSAEAIADMALENYVEMRDTVREPRFALQKALAFALEREFPDRFVPRYSMVMFHPEISYAEAQARGRVQQALLDELTAGIERLEHVDRERARRLVLDRLPP